MLVALKTVFKRRYKQKNVIFAFLFSGEHRDGKERVKENEGQIRVLVQRLSFHGWILYSRDSFMKWIQIVNYYAIRKRKACVLV